LSLVSRGLNYFLESNCDVYVIYPTQSNFINENFEYKKITEIYNGPIKCGFYKLKKL